MANLQQIDLDSNLVIPTQEGQKVAQLEMIAEANGYTEMVANKEMKTNENLTGEEATAFAEAVREDVNLQFVNAEKQEDGKYKINYFDNTPIDNPKTKEQFAKSIIGKYLLGLVINAQKFASLSQAQADLEAQSNTIKAQAQAIETQVVDAFNDVELL